MVGGIYNALSGVAAAQTRLNASAHNIANSQTDGFKAARAVAETQAGSGVRVSLEQVGSPGPVALRETTQGLVEREGSNVRLEQELVDLVATKHYFQANIAAFRTHNDNLGTILDIVE